ncbi:MULTISPECIES: LptE family protein [unclassified Mucilaginibacter]|uniref:LptE family protein n=1 Tax=unclassified Mucilaginibacter TaxID=2617802 RepID=UPI002AC9336C|nr:MULTISPECIES: LptE family protein [unclassified Mucilaginibacter]MEB0260479.1 LptE family protein [Mucilaginibacter sp. 10I4]MEB0280061.1 LptE family protein [Mucilaginibacter sp. 10B2]MEB0302759.1 LptE family protein [Mucilaginibacter sp. 5C4]WPX23597.1 LptE family protein [Mucilaginibacter sp. 5C4]
MKKRLFLNVLTLGMVVMLFNSCAYKLSLNGASIPVGLKTIDVQFFENNAQLVVPTLSQTFTEALKNRIRSQTSISITRGEANATMSGAITGYSIAPVSIQATNSNTAPIAGASRLSITVTVKYMYEADKKLNFEETFTKYKEFVGDSASQEQTLIPEIVKQLTDDIFNRAFANW